MFTKSTFELLYQFGDFTLQNYIYFIRDTWCSSSFNVFLCICSAEVQWETITSVMKMKEKTFYRLAVSTFLKYSRDAELFTTLHHSWCCFTLRSTWLHWTRRNHMWTNVEKSSHTRQENTPTVAIEDPKIKPSGPVAGGPGPQCPY